MRNWGTERGNSNPNGAKLMASRRLVAAAAAAASPSPLARLVSRPGLAGPAGRYWPAKVNFSEDPMNPMRWRASRGFSTEVREPVDKAVRGIEAKEPAGKAGSGSMWNRATNSIRRIKHPMETTDLQEKAMALYVYLLFGLGTPTVLWVKMGYDIYRRR